MSAPAVALNAESIPSMTGSAAKFAKWIVRVLEPRVVAYKFNSRKEEVHAKKFQCLLVSNNAKQYAEAIVPFNFQKKDAADKAAQQFKEGTVWEIRNPVFDGRSKTEFVGAPLKKVLTLQAPTQFRPVPPTEAAAYGFPLKHIEPPLKLADLVCMRHITMPARGQASGVASADTSSRTVDIACQILSKKDKRDVLKDGRQLKVMEVDIADDSKVDAKYAKCTISVWGSAIDLVDKVDKGAGAILLGCTASRKDGEIKLSLYEGNARIILEGPRVTALKAIEFDSDDDFGSVTQEWTPSHQPLAVEGDAVYMCAAGLACVVPGTLEEARGFQINRAMMEAPLTKDQIYTQKGDRLFFSATLRDCTGAVDVLVVDKAAPTVFGLDTAEEVERAVQDGSLAVCRKRLNVRGVCRNESGMLKCYIAEIALCPNTDWVSQEAFRQAVGLTRIQGDIVVPSALKDICECPLLGLAVQGAGGKRTGAYRVLVLVQGTTKSTLTKVTAGTEEAFLVESSKVQCQLGGEELHANIRGYCKFEDMLQYRLDTEVALVSVSSCTPASESELLCLTIDHMEKVSESQKLNYIEALRREIEVTSSEVTSSSAEQPAIVQPPRKCRRIDREPTSPSRTLR